MSDFCRVITVTQVDTVGYCLQRYSLPPHEGTKLTKLDFREQGDLTHRNARQGRRQGRLSTALPIGPRVLRVKSCCQSTCKLGIKTVQLDIDFDLNVSRIFVVIQV